MIHSFFQDLRYGIRMLLRNPGFAGVIALTMALGIGANTVIFSFANILVLRPLPIQDSSRLGWIWGNSPLAHNDRARASLPEYAAYRDGVHAFSVVSGYRQDTFTMTGRGDAERVTAQSVIGNLQKTWGLRTVAGRTLNADDERAGSPKVVVLSHRYWTRRFAASPSLIGDALIFDGEPYQVVGVLTPDIEIGNLSELQVWTPIQTDPALGSLHQRTLRVVGRLNPGATLAEADTAVKAIADRLATEHPETNRGWSARVVPTKEALVSADGWLVMTLLMIVVGLLLLIVCANITNMLLGRVVTRQHEIAVRTALGAGQGRLLRQLLTENLLLGGLGGVLGVVIGWLSLKAIRLSASEPFFELLSVDRNVLTFAIMLSMISLLLFTTLPALQATRRDVGSTLKEAGTRTTGGRRARRSRNFLIGAQVSLAVSLLIVAGLVVRSMMAFTHLDLGFDPAGLLTMQLELPERKYRDDAAIATARERLLESLTRAPGVRSAGLVSSLPALGQDPVIKFDVEGRAPSSRPEERPWFRIGTASRDYFQTAGIPVLRGRAFTTADRIDQPAVAVLSREAARRYWSDPTAAVGSRFSWTDETGRSASATVIGIVGNTVSPDLEAAPDPQMYLSADQRPERAFAVMVRGADPAALNSHVRQAVRAVDADLAIYKLTTMQEALDIELSSSLILTSLFGAFAVLALLLATTGLYAVISYSVTQRKQEIAVRVALGASPHDIRWLVFGEGFKLTLAGLAVGLLGAVGLARTMASILYGVTPTDPLTYGAVLAALLSAAFVASLAPAMRAASIDPVRGLRQE